MTRRSYATNLSPAQYELLAPLLPPAKPGGRPRSVNVFEVVNAIFYLVRAGCAWRLLPHDFPAWQTVYHYFRQWEADGTSEALNHALRQHLRDRVGRNRLPSAACLDSQSVKTAGAAQERGFDGGKKVNGRKRTIVVDTMGLLLGATVHSARRSDHDGLTLLGIGLASAWSCLQVIWTDKTFGGKSFVAWIEQTFGWPIEVVQRSAEQQGFQLLPRPHHAS